MGSASQAERLILRLGLCVTLVGNLKFSNAFEDFFVFSYDPWCIFTFSKMSLIWSNPSFTAVDRPNARFSRDVTAAMLVHRTIAKKVFWDFDYIIMQNLSDILFTNMAVWSREWKPRIESLSSRRFCHHGRQTDWYFGAFHLLKGFANHISLFAILICSCPVFVFSHRQSI